jgi:hypothetical protein
MLVRATLVVAAIVMAAIGSASPVYSAPLSPSCDYVNVDGQCRPAPDQNPGEGGLDLPCRDGTMTHATHRNGACSHHGGLA